MTPQNSEALFKGITFIEENLKRPISLNDICDATGGMRLEFSDIFKQLTAHTIEDYLLRRRLSEAAFDILEEHESIDVIAKNYQFDSLYAFEDAFKELFDMTPKTLQESRDVHLLQWKRRFSMDYINHLVGHNYREPEKVLISSLNLAGHVTSDRHFHSKSGQNLKKEEELTHYVHMHMEHRHLHEYAYMKGIGILGKPITNLTEVPADWLCKPISNLECLKFEYNGSYFQIQNVYTYIFETWMPRSGYKIEVPYVIEQSVEANKTIIYIPIIHIHFDDKNSV